MEHDLEKVSVDVPHNRDEDLLDGPVKQIRSKECWMCRHPQASEMRRHRHDSILVLTLMMSAGLAVGTLSSMGLLLSAGQPLPKFGPVEAMFLFGGLWALTTATHSALELCYRYRHHRMCANSAQTLPAATYQTRQWFRRSQADKSVTPVPVPSQALRTLFVDD